MIFIEIIISFQHLQPPPVCAPGDAFSFSQSCSWISPCGQATHFSSLKSRAKLSGALGASMNGLIPERVTGSNRGDYALLDTPVWFPLPERYERFLSLMVTSQCFEI